MFNNRLVRLRKQHHLSQEELAEQLGISRQTLSKWENGDSAPDILLTKKIADFFDVTLDALVTDDLQADAGYVPPRGKHAFGSVTVDSECRITLPSRALEIFDIRPGDRLILLGDEGQGLALIRQDALMKSFEILQKGEA